MFLKHYIVISLNAFANLTYLCIQSIYHFAWFCCMYECMKKWMKLSFNFPFLVSIHSLSPLNFLITFQTYFHKIDAFRCHLNCCSLPQMCKVSIFLEDITNIKILMQEALFILSTSYILDLSNLSPIRYPMHCSHFKFFIIISKASAINHLLFLPI